MSIWSGIAAAGIAVVLALVVLGQPIWEWHEETSQEIETWSYGPFSARHTVVNKTSGLEEERRDYPYDQLASLPAGQGQPEMAKTFGEFGRFLIFGLAAGFGGIAIAVVSSWKKLRGIFAGVTFLAACGILLYASFALVLAVPSAAVTDRLIPIREFVGSIIDQTTGRPRLSWTPLAGWILATGAGLAFAWGSSDLWHIRPSRKGAPVKGEVTIKRPSTATPPPPPPAEIVPTLSPEPVIEEVFVIGSNGLLIKHMSRSLMSDKDRDVVGSMISAISSFVREAFTERDGEVHEVSLGDHRFVMCNDQGLVVAVLVTSGQTEGIVHRLRDLLAVLRDRYGDRLARWQGETLEGIEDELGVVWDAYHLPPPPAA